MNHNHRKPLVILSGPTAAGKTDLSVALAKSIKGEIISADSMQVYKGMDIGTAKITLPQMQGIPHYLIDELDPDENFSVYEFRKRAARYIDQILMHGHIPILVGGTGFYIQSVLYDIEFTETQTNPEYRRSLEALAESSGPGKLHEMLSEIDPEAAEQIHANNVKRVIRALEFYHQTHTPISLHNKQQRLRQSEYNYAYFVLNRERGTLYERIEKRTEDMIGHGLVEEVRGLLESGVSPSAISMQGLGYKEIVLYLEGKLSLAEAVDLLKKNTRHFAKRQLTWFRREKNVIWMNYESWPDQGSMLESIIDILKEKHIVPIS